MSAAGYQGETEVCIIGAGPAGGIIALELAGRGIRSVILEAGPRHDFARRFEYMRRFLKGENPWKTPLAALDRYTTGGRTPYRLEGNRARGVGGSTLYWEGYALRFRAEDFRLRSLHGVAEDWPVSYEELEPYYTRAERALGVAGTADDPWASPRSGGFPLLPFPPSYSDGLFVPACRSLGITLHSLPQARNSIPYAGRARCQGYSTCHVCPIGAKASADLSHILRAEATGHARVLADVSALRLETGPPDRVRAVVYAGHDRRERRLSARLFVVAAGGVETARLLLLSASRDAPQGLANGSGLVGRHFMSHPLLDITGRVAEPVYPYRIGFSTTMTGQFAVGRDRRRRGAFFLEFLNSAGGPPARLAIASRTWGPALEKHVKEEFGRTLGVRIFCEQLPDPARSVSLNPGVKDHFGQPVPHISWGVGDYARAALEEARGIAERILRGAGAKAIRASRLGYASHQMGTHRMGTDPDSSVVDANLRAHDVSNLYLVGGGCFVTASAFPPTLTVAALAIRAAEHLTRVLRG
ncbi:MAG: GMC family oxidoreductase [Candidatus Rokubacteria bacterium]|nr:GMC family oxidoreductase [Candidatus Rokubacteria bacterium]